jgi:valyl-tRNA synthetase
MQMEKAYNPGAIEERWYQRWEEAGIFAPAGEGESYSITIPPPNVTGILHMGHALDLTLQDIPIRFQRMMGRRTLWLPGTDHAGIATQNVVERALEEEGKSRESLGREEFVRKVWDWVQEYGGSITQQIRRMGLSVDWSRERFTMDEVLSTAVTNVFIHLYKKGLIYKGHYIVNWCPRCHTAISNEEVKHLEHEGHLWHIRYPGAEGDEGVVVATTRPETMLGDAAVAVHPDDGRYTDLIGTRVILPLLNREIPVIADEAVDSEFGTGAVKVTPAHDPNDYEIAQRHKLPSLIAIDSTATITEVGGPYKGMDRFEARRAVVEDLEREGLLVRIVDHHHAVGHCHRCNTSVEPMLSEQWFVRMKPLADMALEKLEEGEPKIQPVRWEKVYRHWLENIRDWCISRQLWWGHRIPVWYCGGDGQSHKVASAERPDEACVECGSDRWEQDPDVLDTWFSSWLWPFSTMGWPDETGDLKTFYPTSLLVSGYDILFFWDARMVMAGLEFTGKVPFEHLYIHGMILDELGRPMSKSLGNGIDPIEMVERYGADAVRYSLCVLTTEGQDIRLAESKFEMGRNFTNKLWNASRFVLMNIDGHGPADGKVALELADRWILSRFQGCVDRVTLLLKELKYSEAAKDLYIFVWNEFCDWYLELVKERLGDPESEGADAARAVLVFVLDGILRLLHPYMPFVTSEIWELLGETLGGVKTEFELSPTTTVRLVKRDSDFLLTAPWPKPNPDHYDTDAEIEVGMIQDAVTAVRNIKGEMNVPPGSGGTVHIRADDEDSITALRSNEGYIRSLGDLDAVEVAAEISRPPASGSAIVRGMEIYLPLEGLIDLEVERERLAKEVERLKAALSGAESKLANQRFLEKAPAEVVERESEKRDDIRERLQKVEELLESLSA